MLPVVLTEVPVITPPTTLAPVTVPETLTLAPVIAPAVVKLPPVTVPDTDNAVNVPTDVICVCATFTLNAEPVNVNPVPAV